MSTATISPKAALRISGLDSTGQSRRFGRGQNGMRRWLGLDSRLADGRPADDGTSARRGGGTPDRRTPGAGPLPRAPTPGTPAERPAAAVRVGALRAASVPARPADPDAPPLAGNFSGGGSAGCTDGAAHEVPRPVIAVRALLPSGEPFPAETAPSISAALGRGTVGTTSAPGCEPAAFALAEPPTARAAFVAATAAPAGPPAPAAAARPAAWSGFRRAQRPARYAANDGVAAVTRLVVLARAVAPALEASSPARSPEPIMP